MDPLKISKNKIHTLMFFGYLTFIGTTLKLTLGLTAISLIVNAAVISLPVLIIASNLRAATLSMHDTWMGLATVLMILLPLFNLLIVSRSYAGIVQTLSFIFPWLVFLSVIFNQNYISKNQAKFWRWFNNFLIVLTFLGLLEYVACIFYGVVPPYVDTSNGEFLVGWFTVFHALDPYTPHYRFYGPFAEAGDLAMWASVLIFYNLLRKNYFALMILCLGAFFAASPSVLISFVIGAIVYTFKTRNIYYFTMALTLIPALIFYFNSDLGNFGQEILIDKQTSLQSRYDSTSGFFNKLGALITSYPLGIPAYATTAEASASGTSFAANFTAITAFERGGVICFGLYLLLLCYGAFNSVTAILTSNKSLLFNEIYLYYLILLPFAVQRGALFEFGIFPLLFSSVFLQRLRRSHLVTV